VAARRGGQRSRLPALHGRNMLQRYASILGLTEYLRRCKRNLHPRFSKKLTGNCKMRLPCWIVPVRLKSDQSAYTRLDDRSGAIRARIPGQVNRASVERNPETCRVINRIPFSVFSPEIFVGTFMTNLDIVVNSTREAIVPQRANLVHRTSDHAAHLRRTILAPIRYVLSQFDESDVPFCWKPKPCTLFIALIHSYPFWR
jgi:hypothetical protein